MTLSADFSMKNLFSVPVIVAALGYFVDIYDLLLFGIVRVTSLQSLGLSGQSLLDEGVFLLNMQMAGMLIGGVFWGILGDKKGRVKILFGSIFIYSIANIANGFVTGVNEYAFWRFVAGVGLAGELGAGVTLVLESLPRESRGYGTMIVASVGVMGAVVANYVATLTEWRTAFFIGGGLGVALLVLRVGAFESGMYRQMETSGVKRGEFLSLFTSRDRFTKYFHSTMIGLPQWFAVGILITFSPEFGKALNISGPILAGQAIMYTYAGLILGDIVSGSLSQYLGTRKKVVYGFMMFFWLAIAIYFTLDGVSPSVFYVVCFVMGVAAGYWAVIITMAAEQFGSNMRATVASTVPNFIRGMVIPMTFSFSAAKNYFGVLGGAGLVGVVCCVVAFYSLTRLDETYGKDLNYMENI